MNDFMRAGICVAASLGLVQAVVAAETHPAADAFRASAQINNISDAEQQDVVVLRRDGSRDIAVPYMYLFSGDRLLLRGSRPVVTLLVKGVSERVTIEAAQQRQFVVGGELPKRRLGWLSELIARYDYLFAGSPVATTITTKGRGESEGGDQIHTGLASPSAGRQIIPRGDQQLALVWTGDVTSLDLIDDVGHLRQSLPAVGKQTISLGVSEKLTHMSVIARGLRSGESVTWTIERGDIPRPDPEPNALSPVEQALWLATDGPPEYRLYGHSQLKALSSQDFVGQRLWDAVRSGQLSRKAQ